MIVDPRPCIYFMKPIELAGPIKVGFTSAVDVRLIQCLKWSPFPLEIIATYPVGAQHRRIDAQCSIIERCFHLRYADHHKHGEWFETHPLILVDIEAINAGTFDPSVLPPWAKISRGKLTPRKLPRGTERGDPAPVVASRLIEGVA